MMKIFFTGKTSFIGRNLLEYLSNFSGAYNIYAPSHFELDLTDEEAVTKVLKEGKFDVVIHAAMYNKIFDHPNMMTESLRIFYNLEKNNELYGKMYYFGSGAEFDKTIDISSASEEDIGRCIPKNYYGLAKYIMSKQAIASNNIYNLRLFAVFGKYEDWKSKFISNACCRSIFDLPITIAQNVIFDYMYIDDLCEIVEKFLYITPRYHDYNICSGKKISLNAIAQKVVLKKGKNLDISISNEGCKPEYTGSNKRMLKEIDFEFADIDKCISALYDWYESNIELINRSML
jgi:UDP-glucose 4-epimerase